MNIVLSLKTKLQIITLNFISSDENIKYSLLCKKTEKFSKIEELLYENFPQYKSPNNYFLINNNRIIKDRTLEENILQENDILELFNY